MVHLDQSQSDNSALGSRKNLTCRSACDFYLLSTALSATPCSKRSVGLSCSVRCYWRTQVNWNAQDNKKYRGKIDRIFVSQTEDYEVDYYINDYLKTRHYALTDENRAKVGKKMDTYQGRAPIQRKDMDAFLDKGWKT